VDLGLNLRYQTIGRRQQVYRILFVYDAYDVFVIRVLHASRDRLTADEL